MKTFFLPAYTTAGGGGGAFSPADRADLINWYRKGIGQTNVSGLTSWADQKGTDNLNQISGAKGAINGDGTVTWNATGTIWLENNTGYHGISDNSQVFTPPWAVYVRAKVHTRDGTDLRGIFAAVSASIGYRATGGEVDQFVLNASNDFRTGGGADLVGVWHSLALVSNTANFHLKCDGGTISTVGSALGNLNGISLGGGFASHFGNVIVAEMAVFHGVDHAETDIDEMFAYLATVI